MAIGCASSGCERWQQPSRPTSVRRPTRTIWREEQLTAVGRRQMNNSRRAGMGIKSAVQLSHRRAVSARATNSARRDMRSRLSTAVNWAARRLAGQRAGQRSGLPTDDGRVLARKGGEHRLTASRRRINNCPLTAQTSARLESPLPPPLLDYLPAAGSEGRRLLPRLRSTP